MPGDEELAGHVQMREAFLPRNEVEPCDAVVTSSVGALAPPLQRPEQVLPGCWLEAKL